MSLGEDMVIALRLANGGWWGGDPGAVLRAPADEVMLAVHYENFKGSYEAEAVRMARAETA